MGISYNLFVIKKAFRMNLNFLTNFVMLISSFQLFYPFELLMKKCVLLIYCILLLVIEVNAQSFHTSMNIKKSDCDTLNGTARVIPDVLTGSYTYRWSTGASIDSIMNLSPGVYYVTVSHFDTLGVFIDSLIDTATITFSSVSISIFSTRNPTCGANNGAILSSITGGSGAYTFYTINGGTNYPGGVNLPSGLFQVVAFDNVTGCNSDSISVILRDTGGYFRLQDTDIIDINCFDDTTGSISITLTGGLRPYRFVWTGSTDIDSFISNLGQGIYTVNITDSLCPTTNRVYRFEVKGPSDTLVLNASFTNDTCYRKVGNILLSATGGTPSMSYFLADGTSFSGRLDSLNAGMYGFYVLDNKGCTDSLEVNIGNSGGPSAQVILLDSTCAGFSNGAIRIKVTSRDRPNHFTWSHDASIDSNFVNHLAAGTYTVSVSNNIGCDTILNIEVANYFTPYYELIGDTTILQGQSALLTALLDYPFVDSVYWLPNYNLVALQTNASVFPMRTTIYHEYIRLENGCYLDDSVLVQVDSIPIEIRIPNIFTPNADGINDLLKIQCNEAIRNIELHIYDRWGNNVFDSYSKEEFWDGMHKYTHKLCETGVYTYFIYIDTFVNKDRIIKEGNISLIR